MASGDRLAAAEFAIEVLSAQATTIDALWALFLIRKTQGEPAAAMALIRRLTNLTPTSSCYSAHLIEALVAEKSWDEAEAAARKIVRLAPEDAQAHATLALVFSIRERLIEGEFHFRRALKLCRSRPPRLLMQLAINLESQARLDDARSLYEEAEASPLTADEARFALSRLAGICGDIDAMNERLSGLEACALQTPAVIGLKARIAYDKGDAALALSLYGPALPQAETLNATDCYLVGQSLNRRGLYDDAFAYFEKANALHQGDRGQSFDPRPFERVYEDTRGFMTEEAFSLMPAATKAPGSQPLFIVGFPRSGTTMLEQSLAMHSRIMAGGELASLLDVANATGRLLASPMAYPFTLSQLWMGDQRHQIGLLRDHYLNSARRSLQGQTGVWFTDKAMTHELYLGLIHVLFPRSPVVHLVRHPLDVVISNYANGLPHGGYRGGLKEIAEFLLLLFQAADHFQEVAPSPRFMRVRYEDIVDDQDHWMRKIFSHLGETFEPDCMRFHESTRTARTLSRQQVKEPINGKSKFWYRNYLRYMKPAIDVLEPLIVRLGYSI